MSAWIVVPCLLSLRDEFNALAPARDKGSDGTIGDAAHTSSSDHTPDEDSDVLRGKDADSINEVHALDIDSTGPWPAGRTFHQIVMDVIALERAKWLSATDKCRLKYVIHDGQLYSTDNDFAPVKYNGDDQHYGHAHFSARYETSCENDTRPWGVMGDDVSKQDVIDAFKTDGVFKGPANAASVIDGTNTEWTLAGFAQDASYGWREIKTLVNALPALSKAVADLAARQGVDTAALLAAINGVDEAVLAGLVGQTNEQLAAALKTALGDRAAAVGALLSAK